MVTLTGTRFRAGARVRINGKEASLVRVVSESEISIETPALGLQGGAAAVELVNDDGVGVVSRSILQIIDVSTTFTAPVSTVIPSAAFMVAIADMTGDGRNEVIVPRPDGSAVGVHQPDSTLFLAVLWTTPVFGNPAWVAIGDFNGDSRPDVAAAMRNSRFVEILRNNGSGLVRTPMAVPELPVGLAVGDVTGDGIADIVVGGVGSVHHHLLVGQGDGTFTPTDVLVGSFVPYPSVGRIGTDGRLAIFGSSLNNEFLSIVREPTTTQRLVTRSPVGGLASFQSLVVDLDGRGTLDLVATSPNGGALVARGRSDDYFDDVRFLRSARGEARGIAAADLNGDGVADLVVSGPGSEVTVFPNEGDAQFTQPMSLVMPGLPSSVAVGDLDGDGKPELVVPQGSNSAIFVYRNTSPTPMP